MTNDGSSTRYELKPGSGGSMTLELGGNGLAPEMKLQFGLEQK